MRRPKTGGTGAVLSHCFRLGRRRRYLSWGSGRHTFDRLRAGGDCPWNRRAKSSLPIRATALECPLNRLDNCLANSGRIAKTNFAFCRVYIHIHLARVDVNEQERNRKLSAHESGVITFAQGRGENAALDRASVNEDELLRPRLPACPGAPAPAPNLEP